MPRRRRYIKNLAATLGEIAAAHPSKALQLWCEDEAREGQKGRTGHRWFTRGVRPPGRRDRRFLSTYIFAAVRPGHDDAFALVLPEAKAVTMDVFLARFAETLPAGVHAVLMLDQAGWHGQATLQVPETLPCCRCRPTRRSSTRWSGSGYICGSAFCHSACIRASKPSWTRSAPLGMRYVCARQSWRGPAGGRPVQVRGSARLVASVAWRKVTTAAKRTQRLCGVGY